jgi:hypothetical protein
LSQSLRRQLRGTTRSALLGTITTAWQSTKSLKRVLPLEPINTLELTAQRGGTGGAGQVQVSGTDVAVTVERVVLFHDAPGDDDDSEQWGCGWAAEGTTNTNRGGKGGPGVGTIKPPDNQTTSGVRRRRNSGDSIPNDIVEEDL